MEAGAPGAVGRGGGGGLVPDALVELGLALVAAHQVGGGAGQRDQQGQLAAAAPAWLGLGVVGALGDVGGLGVLLGQLVLVPSLAAHESSSTRVVAWPGASLARRPGPAPPG